MRILINWFSHILQVEIKTNPTIVGKHLVLPKWNIFIDSNPAISHGAPKHVYRNGISGMIKIASQQTNLNSQYNGLKYILVYFKYTKVKR